MVDAIGMNRQQLGCHCKSPRRLFSGGFEMFGRLIIVVIS